MVERSLKLNKVINSEAVSLGMTVEVGQQIRAENLEQMRELQARGLKVARACAVLLKREFQVERVVLFGSLLDPQRLWWGSDIDLAVWGLAKADLFRAGAAIEHGHDFSIDLIPVTSAKPHIISAINQGIEL